MSPAGARGLAGPPPRRRGSCAGDGGSASAKQSVAQSGTSTYVHGTDVLWPVFYKSSGVFGP